MSDDVKRGDSDPTLDLEEEQGTSSSDRSMDVAERSEDDESDDADSTSLDLDDDQDEGNEVEAKSAREQEAERHARSYAARILAGKATLADVPKNHQYLLPQIEDILGVGKKKQEVERPKREAEKPLDRKTLKQELKDDLRYDDLVEELKAADLTPAQVNKFNEKRKLFLSRGLSKLEATETAIEIAGIDLKAEAPSLPSIMMGSRRTASPAGKKYDGSEDPNKMSRKELAEFKSKQPRKHR